jgi:hypothetical protein
MTYRVMQFSSSQIILPTEVLADNFFVDATAARERKCVLFMTV